MKMHTINPSILKLVLLVGATSMVACGDDGNANDDGSTGNADTSATNPTATEPTATNPTATEPTATNPTATDPSDTEPDPSATEPTATDPTADTTADDSTGDDPFEFAEDPYSAYTQIDRHGAVEAGTAGILASQGLGLTPGSDIALRDDYNASNPAEDADGMWLTEIADSVVFFHNSFDDDIEGLGLVPATVDQTVAQAGPVILPDTIKYDPAVATGYPNGRALTDRVVDITLAAVLLELGEQQPLDLFASIPLNPGANDVAFGDEFPYLAPAHVP